MTACRDLFSNSGLTGVDLQVAVGEKFPNGDCEQVSVSEHSPGPVADSEALTRIIFHPIHVHPTTGLPVSTAFSDAWSSDLSTFRDPAAADHELALAISEMQATGLKKSGPRTVAAFATAEVAVLRAEILPKSGARSFRVYDTAEEVKPHHASVFLTPSARGELSEKSTRKRLFELFQAVTSFRNGRLSAQPNS